MAKRLKSAAKKPKRPPGRPVTGARPFTGVRLSAEALAVVDKLAQEEGTSRGAMLRRLVDEALAVRANRRKP
jgi:Ribbon-helix-helix protein, copG family